MLQRNDEISVNVKAQKMFALDNQQPSSEQGKVQRLSGNAEYTQVGGKSEQPVHTCKDCGETDISKFGIRRDYNRPWNYCRKCRQARNIDTQRKYAQNAEVREKKKLSDKQYAKKNADQIKEYHKQYQTAHRERLLAATKERYEKNKERHLANAARWKKENAGKVNHTCMMRHSDKMLRVPKWLTTADKQAMDAIYNQCRSMNEEAGFIKYHVDHVMPLRGKTVSGLHAPNNLQILLASVNCSKQNKVDNIVCSA